MLVESYNEDVFGCINLTILDINDPSSIIVSIFDFSINLTILDINTLFLKIV